MEAKTGASLVSESDLTKSVKGLRTTKGREHTDSLEYDTQIAEKLAKLYEKHDADLREIFKELEESPRKALKYPPTSADEFGMKYAQGFYTYADAK